jgi:Pyridoxamine 5'-phosphate oxidase
MLSWSEFASDEPAMAAAGAALLYQFGGVGLAFLATTRGDGGPRVHPVCPIFHSGQLWGFLIQSPKRHDLHRDPRYAMHCYPPENNENAFYITGVARAVADDAVRKAVATTFLAERSWSTPPPEFGQQELFEFLIQRALLTTTDGHGDPHPRHRVWKAERGPSTASGG